MRIEVSREEKLLDSGGGLKKASWFFLEEGANLQEPFILHNVDVISNIDLARMLRFHVEQDALATLAVQDRVTSRPLLFDTHGQFCGRAAGPERNAYDGNSALGRSGPGSEGETAMQELAFTGIHVISPRIFREIGEEGAFSIIHTYIRLAARGERIRGFRADEYYWRDLGRPESVALAAEELARET
jgi:NDP-sugar pyrophosphorylase family protein